MSQIYFPNKPIGGGGDDYIDPMPYYHIGTGKDYATFALARAAAIANNETNAIAVIHEDLDESIDIPVDVFAGITTPRWSSGYAPFSVNKVVISGDSDREFVLNINVLGVDDEDVIQQTGESSIRGLNCTVGLEYDNGTIDITKTPARLFFQSRKNATCIFDNVFLFKFNFLAGALKGAVEHRGKVDFYQNSTLQFNPADVAIYCDAPYRITDEGGVPFEVDDVITGATSTKTAKVAYVEDGYLGLYDVEPGFIDGEDISNADESSTAKLETDVTIRNEYFGASILGQMRGSNTTEFLFYKNTIVSGNSPTIIVNEEAGVTVDNSRIFGAALGSDYIYISGTGNARLRNPDFGDGGLNNIDQDTLNITNDTYQEPIFKTLEIQTGEIAASGNEQINAAIISNVITLHSVKVTKTAGDSTQMNVQIFSKDDFSTDGRYIIGYDFGNIDPTDPYRGPDFQVPGGGTLKAPQSYEDKDESNELHIEINNADGANSGTYLIEIIYLALPE